MRRFQIGIVLDPLILVAKDFLHWHPDKTSFSSVLFLSLSSIYSWTPLVPDVEGSSW